MRKSFLGYNVAETDQEIASLQNQRSLLEQRNEKLESDLKDMNSEVTNLKNEASEARAQLLQATSSLEDMRSRFYELQEEFRQYKAEAELQRKRYSEVDVTEFNKTIQRACKDVAETKENARVKMEHSVNDFTDSWISAQDNLYDVVRQLDSTREKAQDEFLTAQKQILAQFKELESRTQHLFDHIQDLQDERGRLSGELMEEVDKLDAVSKAEDMPEASVFTKAGETEENHKSEEDNFGKTTKIYANAFGQKKII